MHIWRIAPSISALLVVLALHPAHAHTPGFRGEVAAGVSLYDELNDDGDLCNIVDCPISGSALRLSMLYWAEGGPFALRVGLGMHRQSDDGGEQGAGQTALLVGADARTPGSIIYGQFGAGLLIGLSTVTDRDKGCCELSITSPTAGVEGRAGVRFRLFPGLELGGDAGIAAFGEITVTTFLGSLTFGA